MAAKYSMDTTQKWKDLPEYFQHAVINGDDELLRVAMSGKFVSMKYKGIEEILKEQYNKGMLTVDFQAMLNMEKCHTCH